MASFIDPHLPLLLAPFSPVKKSKQRRKVVHFSDKPEARMWTAIAENDEPALRQALQDGAKTTTNQNGTPPLWATVEQGKLGLAKLLLEFGANPKVEARGGNLWKAIAKRNNPAEADQLKALLGSARAAKPKDFVLCRSYKLVEWWVAQDLPDRMTKADTGSSSWEWNYDWVIAAVYGPAGLWDYLSKAWGIQAGNPHSLSLQAGSSTARGFWEDIIRRDNVELAQEALRRGWGPPEPSDYKINYSLTVDKGSRTLPLYWKCNLGWAMLDAKAENLWAWWSQIPGTLECMQADSLPDNHREGTTTELLKTAKNLETLADLGLFHPGPDAKGRLLAHHVFSQNEVHASLITWWIKNRPQDLETADAAGKTPLHPTDKGSYSNEAVLRKVRTEQLNQALPEVQKNIPARTRF